VWKCGGREIPGKRSWGDCQASSRLEDFDLCLVCVQEHLVLPGEVPCDHGEDKGERVADVKFLAKDHGVIARLVQDLRTLPCV
jgi:hypothetical protein